MPTRPLLLVPGRRPSRRLRAWRLAAGGALLLALGAWGAVAGLAWDLGQLRRAADARAAVAVNGGEVVGRPSAEATTAPLAPRPSEPDRLLRDLQQALQAHPVQLMDYRAEPARAAVPPIGASAPALDLLRLRGSTRWQGRYADLRAVLRDWASRHPGFTLLRLELQRLPLDAGGERLEARLDFALLDLPRAPQPASEGAP